MADPVSGVCHVSISSTVVLSHSCGISMLDPSGSTSMLADLPPIDVEISVQPRQLLDSSLVDVRYLHDDMRRIPCRRLPIMLVQIAYCRRVR
jgi:hypothetical protein